MNKGKTMPVRLHASQWWPWMATFTTWAGVCALSLILLGMWQDRERGVLEAQAKTLVHALGNVLRVTSARAARQEGVLDEVLARVTEAPGVTGVALVDSSGQCLAISGMPKAGSWNNALAPNGIAYLPNDVLVWDTVALGRWMRWGQGQGQGQGRGQGQGPGTGTETGRGPWRNQDAKNIAGGRSEQIKLFVLVPLTSLRDRWQRDRYAMGGICTVFLGLAVAVAMAWTLARRSTAYSAELQIAAEQKHALEEMNLVAAGLAHEIKNPLGVIRGIAQRLSTIPAPADELPESLTVMREEIDRTTSRINELLSFASPKAPVRQSIDLHHLLRDLQRLLDDELADAGLSLQINGEDLVLSADPELLRRLFFNLLHNVIRFAPDSGEVEILSQTSSNGRWQITVRDHGPGIPPEHARKVFSPYYTTAAEGTGLGLAVANRIARAHGWTIRCEKAPGGGTVFEIEGESETRIDAGDQD